jgi:hypothetical protein
MIILDNEKKKSIKIDQLPKENNNKENEKEKEKTGNKNLDIKASNLSLFK